MHHVILPVACSHEEFFFTCMPHVLSMHALMHMRLGSCETDRRTWNATRSSERQFSVATGLRNSGHCSTRTCLYLATIERYAANPSIVLEVISSSGADRAACHQKPAHTSRSSGFSGLLQPLKEPFNGNPQRVPSPQQRGSPEAQPVPRSWSRPDRRCWRA